MLKIDRSSAWRRVNQCLTRGYLRNVETQTGQPLLLVLGDSLPEEDSILPTAEKVREVWKRQREKKQ
jgi:hypothetical protein